MRLLLPPQLLRRRFFRFQFFTKLNSLVDRLLRLVVSSSGL
jgi:hypothetical protein